MRYYQRFCGCILEKRIYGKDVIGKVLIGVHNIYPCSKHTITDSWFPSNNGIEFKKIRKKDLPPEAIIYLVTQKLTKGE